MNASDRTLGPEQSRDGGGGDRGSLTIVCSDCPRNGKTILSKLSADLIALRHGALPVIYDTDAPAGDIIRQFPDAARILELEKTPQQVALFDGILSEGGHHLIDLSAHHFPRFFDIYRDIDFETGAAEAAIFCSVYFIIDRTNASLEAGYALSQSVQRTQFIPVRNSVIGDVLDQGQNGDLYHHMAQGRDMLLPALSGEALGMIEHPDFHFDAFVANRYDGLTFELEAELWDFLEVLYEQR